MEEHPDAKCPYDNVGVVAGDHNDHYCGKTLPMNITSTSNTMKVTFLTDASLSMKGFFARFHTEGIGTYGVGKH